MSTNIKDADKSCSNCDHRSFGKCQRVGYHVEKEMKFGGRCVYGTELRLWKPRRSFLQRVISFLRGVA